MSTLSYTAQQLYNMLTNAYCNCRQYISVGQDGSLILANDFQNSYGVFEDIPITKNFIIEYDLTLGSNKNPCFNPTFGSYNKPTSAQYYGFMLSFSEGGRLWGGENNSPTTAQQPIGMSSSAWYGTPNTTYHIKIERDDNTVNLYVDNVLTQTISDNTLRTTEGGYFGFFNWNGSTCKISNVTVTSDIYSNIKKYTNASGVAEIWLNIKNYVYSQLLGKQDTLVSGTNIKTVNNQSLLGSGNVSFTPPTFTYDSSTETLSVSNTTATVFNYDSNTETLEIQVNG